MHSRSPRNRPARLAPLAALAALCVTAWVDPAAAQDREQVQAGLSIWRTKANCQTCHGWSGDGTKMDNQMPDPPDLRESVLDRETLIMTIKCGRPGRGMPAFDRLAYSDGRCYGMRAADLRRDGLMMTQPDATLQPREIEAVADFLFAKVIGKGPMTREKCVEFWESKVAVCDEIPPGN